MTPSEATVRVWDLPTRLFHWTLAATVVGAVVTANIGGAAMAWHFRLGLLALGLLAFRLAWGLVGGRWSRFASFLYTPAALLRYLRGHSRPADFHDVGHSPLASLSVFAMLALLCLQVATGLVADDEIASVGPLNRFVSGATALSATAWHKDWGAGLIVALVVLHVLAIAFHALVRRRRLVRAMVGGDKALPAGTPASVDGLRQRALAAVLALACAALVAWVVRLGGAGD